MLFNKDDNGMAEIKKHIGGLDLENRFENIEPSIIDSKKFVSNVIGDAVYDAADAHYKSDDYNLDDEQRAEIILLNELVYKIQKPIAWYAYYLYSPEMAVTMDDTGFHNQKSNEMQVPAFEWQIKKVENSFLRRAYRATDDLLEFLDKNRNSITEWKESAAEQHSLSLFINSATKFSEHFDIKNSRRLFIALMPTMRRFERKEIKNAITETRYLAMKEKIKNKTALSDDESAVLELIEPALVFLTMSLAVVLLPTEMFPEGILEEFTFSEKSKNKMDFINTMKLQFKQEAEQDLKALVDKIALLDAVEEEETEEDTETIVSYSKSTKGLSL